MKRREPVDEFVTVPVAAALLGVSKATVRRYLRRGLLRGFQLPTGPFRVSADHIEAIRKGLPGSNYDLFDRARNRHRY